MARHRLDRALASLSAFYVAVVLVATLLLSRFSDRWWLATLMAFGPRWPLAAPAVVLAVLGWVWGLRRWAAAVVAVGVIAFGPYMDLSLPFPRSQPEAPPTSKALTVATFNIQERPLQSDFVEQVVKDFDVDVLALVECRAGEHGRQARKLELYDRQVATQFGLCLFSRHPIVEVDGRDPKDAWDKNGSGAIMRAAIDVDGQVIHVVAVHLATARDGLEALRYKRFDGIGDMDANTELRRWESTIAREHADRADGPLLVMGDFNLPVESDIYRRIWSPFVNAFDECGTGYGNTKLTRWFGARIDHILMSAPFRCESAEVLEPRGSDHAPLYARLLLTPP
ncbi:MAG: endonuclease/exonuclease/phosphatase family protein [Polyangiaceae bacterium]